MTDAIKRIDPGSVRVLARKETRALAKLGVEVVRGDLLEPGVVARALEGVESV